MYSVPSKIRRKEKQEKLNRCFDKFGKAVCQKRGIKMKGVKRKLYNSTQAETVNLIIQRRITIIEANDSNNPEYEKH